MNSSLVTAIVLILAAAFEVAGDAVIRRGMQGAGLAIIAVGFVMLGAYGIVVNTLGWDFSRLLGVYVAVFALVAVLAGRFIFAESVPPATWLGLGLIVAGGAVIQVGPRLLGQ